MLDERRRDERAESFEIIRVTAKNQQGDELVFPIMLRDKSQSGFGGVYVGANPLDKNIDYLLEGAEGQGQLMRLAWITPVASHVFILGFRMA